MIRGFYTASTGAIEHQKMLAIAANNMANANNDGYKTSNASFQELIYQRMRMPDNYESRQTQYDTWVRRNKGLSSVMSDITDISDDELDSESFSNYYYENKLRGGAGARVSESALVMKQGSYNETGNPLNALIKGDAFFAVMDSRNGEIAFTRDGSFELSNEDDGTYLVLSTGEYVLDQDYDRILIPDTVKPENIKLVAPSYGEYDDNTVKLGLFTCDNIYGLSRTGTNKYYPTDISGEMVGETRPGVEIISRAVEMSNVYIADEMVKIIQAQRAFQSNLTVIRTADELAAYVNQLRGQ